MRRSRISGLDLATNRIKVRKLHSDARQLLNATRFTGFASDKHDTVWEGALILLCALMVLHNPLLLTVRLDIDCDLLPTAVSQNVVLVCTLVDAILC